jgi:polyhydroxybutyrate depolymerase
VETVLVDGKQRSYMLHAPTGAEGGPLIIALHPLGSNPRLMEAMTSFSEMANWEGFIVAYPEGIKASSVGVRSWNAKFCCDEAMANDVDDIAFLSKIVDSVSQRFGVRGVLVAGFSNGGMLAHLAGIELSDQVDAIATVAATVGKEITEHCPSRPVPALMINCLADRTVPFGYSNKPRLLPAAEAVGFWAHCNNTIQPPKVEEGAGAIKESYAAGSGGAEVVLYKVKDAGHVWPGSRVRTRGENDPGGFNASEAIWEFFRDRLA